MIDEILLFLAKKVGHAGGGEHIYIYIFVSRTKPARANFFCTVIQKVRVAQTTLV